MKEPLDSSDLDALLELERSRGYELVRARLESELERWRTALESVGAGNYVRGQIKALRTALAIPEILKAEIKQTDAR